MKNYYQCKFEHPYSSYEDPMVIGVRAINMVSAMRHIVDHHGNVNFLSVIKDNDVTETMESMYHIDDMRQFKFDN